MKIIDLLKPAAIVSDLRAVDKNGVLEELADALIGVEQGLDRQKVLQVLEERERLGSTGVGEGVAIPHGKLPAIDRLLISFGRSGTGIEFDSMDGKPARLFFLLLAPEDCVGIHLKTLARISKLLKSAAVRNRLLEAAGYEEIYRIISEEEDNL